MSQYQTKQMALISIYVACAVPPSTSPRAEEKDCLSVPAATTVGLLSQIGKKEWDFPFLKKNKIKNPIANWISLNILRSQRFFFFPLIYKAPGIASAIANSDLDLCKACLKLPYAKMRCLVSWAGKEGEAEHDPPPAPLPVRAPGATSHRPTCSQRSAVTPQGWQQWALRFLLLPKSQRNRLAK